MNEHKKKRVEKKDGVEVGDHPEETLEGEVLVQTMADLARAVSDPIFRRELLAEETETNDDKKEPSE